MSWDIIIQYSIMGFISGFTGTKLFSKNKNSNKAIKVGCVTSIVSVSGFLALMWQW